MDGIAVSRLSYRPDEAATAIGLSRSLLYQLIQRGEIPTFHIGRVTLISADELRRWVERRASQEAIDAATHAG